MLNLPRHSLTSNSSSATDSVSATSSATSPVSTTSGSVSATSTSASGAASSKPSGSSVSSVSLLSSSPRDISETSVKGVKQSTNAAHISVRFGLIFFRSYHLQSVWSRPSHLELHLGSHFRSAFCDWTRCRPRSLKCLAPDF